MTPIIHKKIHDGVRMSGGNAPYNIMTKQHMQKMNSTTNVARPIDKNSINESLLRYGEGMISRPILGQYSELNGLIR